MTLMNRLLFIFLFCFSITGIFAQSYKTAEEILTEYNLGKPDMAADDYNSAGFELYKMGQYPDALTLFYETVYLDNDHVKGNYNIACMLSLLYQSDKSFSNVTSELFGFLYFAVSLDPTYRELAKNDPDFNAVRDFMEFKVITAEPDNPVTETEILTYHSSYTIEYEFSISFINSHGEYIVFTDYSSLNKLKSLGLYIYQDERDLPEYIINSSLTGESFLVEYKWIMGDSNWPEFCMLEPVILSVEIY